MKTEAVPDSQSRVLGIAKKLVDEPLNSEQAYSRLVVLTGEAAALTTQNGRWCLLNALHLLCRTVGNLRVQLPEGVDPKLEAEVRELSSRLWSKRSIDVGSANDSLEWGEVTAVLNVGSITRADLPWTSINSNGWVARVSSTARELPQDCGEPNAAAAMLAASFGVVEVFKRVFGVPTEVLPPLEVAEFSLFDHSTAPANLGPRLSEHIDLPDTAMFGAGAIGNACALLLSQLPVRGRVHLIDKQDYADENAETCTQIEREGWIGEPKAERLARWLQENSTLTATGERAYAAEAISNSEKLRQMSIDLVLNGFDDIHARHDVQRLWPSVLVDGGISDVSAGVTQYRVASERFACMKCSFVLLEENVRDVNERLVGLRLSAEDLDRLVTEADIQAAPEELKPTLRQARKENKKWCSIIPDAKATLGANLADDFRPSAPFVAAASAALMMAETIKALVFPDARAVQQFQFGNLFLGPEACVGMDTPARGDCQCVRDRHRHVKHAARRAEIRTQAASRDA